MYALPCIVGSRRMWNTNDAGFCAASHSLPVRTTHLCSTCGGLFFVVHDDLTTCRDFTIDHRRRHHRGCVDWKMSWVQYSTVQQNDLRARCGKHW